MIKPMGLMLCVSVLLLMLQPFENEKPIELSKNTLGNNTGISAGQQVVPKKQVSKLGAEMMDSLKLAKVNPKASRVIIDAIVAANNSKERNFPVDESVYDRVGEVEQPLQSLNEQDMEQQMELAGLSAEQYQVIADGIAGANLSNPYLNERAIRD